MNVLDRRALLEFSGRQTDLQLPLSSCWQTQRIKKNLTQILSDITDTALQPGGAIVPHGTANMHDRLGSGSSDYLRHHRLN